MTTLPGADLADQGQAVYSAMVGLAKPTRVSLEEHGLDPAVLDEQLPRLAAIGMIQVRPDGSIEVVPPDIALTVYASHLERVASQSRQAVDQLTETFRRARATIDQPVERDVRIVVSFTEFSKARVRALAAARESILIVATRSDANDRDLFGLDEDTLRLPPGDVVRKIVSDSSILELEGALDAMAELGRAGAEIRTRPAIALGLVVVDRSIALVDLTNHDPTGIGSIIVRHPPMVHALAALAEAIHAAATPAPTGTKTARRRLGERQAQTLALLAAGASDSTIARQMGISQRTVERYIRQVMDTLGVTTRFQAGVHAERRGLL